MTQIVVVLASRDEKTIDVDAARIERTVANVAPAASVRAMHPGHSSPELRAFLAVDVADEQAEQLMAGLRADPGVDGAYIKPPDAAP